MRDLTKLACPFQSGLIKTNPSGGGSYVAHPVVKQRILDVLGPVSFNIVEIVRGYVPAKGDKDELNGAVVGVVARLTAEIDGRTVTVEDAGDCENPAFWPHDGARLKDAMSDAYKRCAAQIGVGLHLWAGENFYLFERLQKQDKEAEAAA